MEEEGEGGAGGQAPHIWQLPNAGERAGHVPGGKGEGRHVRGGRHHGRPQHAGHGRNGGGLADMGEVLHPITAGQLWQVGGNDQNWPEDLGQ